jgi:uncharacterized membrane protein
VYCCNINQLVRGSHEYNQTSVLYCNIVSILFKKFCNFLSYGFFVTEQIVVPILFILAIIVAGRDNATKTTRLSVKSV